MSFIQRLTIRKSFWIIYLGILAFFCLSCCLSFDFFSKTPMLAIDSSIYYMVGERWLHGEIPYRDVFDHKGPLLYLINLVAVLLGGAKSFFFIEWLVFFLTAFIVKETLDFVVPRSFVCISLLFFPLMVSFCTTPNILIGGNIPDEYAMPLVACCVYYSVRKIQCNEQWRTGDLGIGICLSILFFLKINLVFPALPIVFLWLYEYKEKRIFKNLVQHCFWSIGGFLLVAIPIGFYFLMNNGIESYFFDNFIYNFQYNQSFSSQHGYLRPIICFLRPINALMSTFSLMHIPFCLICVYAFLQREKRLLFVMLVFWGGSFIVASFSGKFVMNYYYFTAIPFFLLVLAVSLYDICSSRNATIILICVLTFANFCLFYKNYKQIPIIRNAFKKTNTFPREIEKIVQENDKIKFVSLDKQCYYYHCLKKYPVAFSKYMYLPLHHSQALEDDLLNVIQTENINLLFYPKDCRFPQIIPVLQQKFNILELDDGYWGTSKKL